MEDKKFNPQEFGKALSVKINNKMIVCPICGGAHFTILDQMASIITSDSFDGIQISKSIPSGMIICENCGHIHFFALGALSLLPKNPKDEDK